MATQVDSANAQLNSLMESMISYSKRTVITNTSRKRDKQILDSVTMGFPSSLSFSSSHALATPLTLPSPKPRKAAFRSHTFRAPFAKRLMAGKEISGHGGNDNHTHGMSSSSSTTDVSTENEHMTSTADSDSKNNNHISNNTTDQQNNNTFQLVDLQQQPAGKMRGRKRSSSEMQRGSSRRSSSTTADGTPARAKKHLTEEKLRERAVAKEKQRSKPGGWKKHDTRHYPVENSIAQSYFAHIDADEQSLFKRYYHLVDKYGVSQKTLSDVLKIFNCTISQVASGVYKCASIAKYTRRCRVWVFLMDRQLVAEISKAWCQVHGIGLNSFVSHAAQHTGIPIRQLQQWFDGMCPVVQRNQLDSAITVEIVKRNPEFRITLNPYAGIPKFKHYAHYNTDKDKEKDKSIILQRMGVTTSIPAQRHSKKANKLTQHEILRVEEENEAKEVTAVFDTVYRHGFVNNFNVSGSFPSNTFSTSSTYTPTV